MTVAHKLLGFPYYCQYKIPITEGFVLKINKLYYTLGALFSADISLSEYFMWALYSGQHLTLLSCSGYILPVLKLFFYNIWERTVRLMGAPAVGFPVKLQRVVRAECNPCSCFAVLSLCIFRLWLSVNSIQAVLLEGRAWKKPPYQTFFSRLSFPSIQGDFFYGQKNTVNLC